MIPSTATLIGRGGSAQTPRLSVIVPATNAPVTLAAGLAAIERSLAPGDEAIVVSDAPGVGPAAARNVGAAHASGEVLVFVDADVEIHPDALARIRARFAADPGLTALFGAYDDRPAAPGVVSKFRNLLHHHMHCAGPGPAQTFWAGLGAVRRDDFLAVGGFDAQRFPRPSVEDVDLGMRLADHGARLLLDPSIQGTHLKRWTLWSMVQADFMFRGVPWVRLLVRRRTAPTALNLGWRHRLSGLTSVVSLIALALGDLALVLVAAVALVALNRSFYALLLRRRGPVEAAAGVLLHVVHHITAAASLVGALLTLRVPLRTAAAEDAPSYPAPARVVLVRGE